MTVGARFNSWRRSVSSSPCVWLFAVARGQIRYCSIHQGGIFPGSGRAEDEGPLGERGNERRDHGGNRRSVLLLPKLGLLLLALLLLLLAMRGLLLQLVVVLAMVLAVMMVVVVVLLLLLLRCNRY